MKPLERNNEEIIERIEKADREIYQLQKVGLKHRYVFAKIYPNSDFTGACTLSQTDKPSIKMIEYSAIIEMENRFEELVKALKFYSNSVSFHGAVALEGCILRDGGKTAREALNKVKVK